MGFSKKIIFYQLNTFSTKTLPGDQFLVELYAIQQAAFEHPHTIMHTSSQMQNITINIKLVALYL